MKWTPGLTSEEWIKDQPHPETLQDTKGKDNEMELKIRKTCVSKDNDEDSDK